MTTVAGGAYKTTCATVDGGVQCWGAHSGSTSNPDNDVPSSIPVTKIAPGSSVTGSAISGSALFTITNGVWRSGAAALTAGGTSAIAAKGTCAVVDGGVKCWGDNTFGQVGNNSTVYAISPAIAIAGGSHATSVSAGSNHTCAIVNGGVQCWGDNSKGQLGNNSTTSSLIPIATIPAASHSTAIAVGVMHSCAVINGGVQCWGDNTSGQLGNNSTVASLTPVIAVPAGSNATAVAAGSSHTCAVVNGGVQCWGYNGRGQLGNSNIPNCTTPSAQLGWTVDDCNLHYDDVYINPRVSSLVPVVAIAAGSGATTVTAGGDYTCAVITGGVACWGDNALATLGNPTIHSASNYFNSISLLAQQLSAPVITDAALGDASLTVTFTPPINSGGTDITGYSAACSAPGSVTRSASVGPGASAITVADLTIGLPYYCVVRDTIAEEPGQTLGGRWFQSNLHRSHQQLSAQRRGKEARRLPSRHRLATAQRPSPAIRQPARPQATQPAAPRPDLARRASRSSVSQVTSGTLVPSPRATAPRPVPRAHKCLSRR